MISHWRLSELRCIRTRMHLGMRLATAISEAQRRGTWDMPMARAASAGKVAVRSGVVVKKIEAISSKVSIRFCLRISSRSSLVAETISSGRSASTVIAPRTPRTAMVRLLSRLFEAKSGGNQRWISSGTTPSRMGKARFYSVGEGLGTEWRRGLVARRSGMGWEKGKNEEIEAVAAFVAEAEGV